MISPLNRGVGQSGGAAPAQNQAVALRVAVIGAVLLGLFAIVFFRLWYLQVLSGDSLAAAATKNRKRDVAITAPRGDILDRNGDILVRNRRAQIVTLTPGSLPMIEREVANQYGVDLAAWIALPQKPRKAKKGERPLPPQKTQQNTPRPTYPSLRDPELLREYAESDQPEDLAKLKKRYDDLGALLQIKPDEVRKRVITNLYLLPYAAIPLRKQGTQNDVVNYLAENAELYPGVTTTSKFVRSYPVGKAGAQLFGQVGPVPIDPKTRKSTIKKYESFNTAAQVGLNGLELQYDGYLRGKDGMYRTTIDAFGSVQGEPTEIKPLSGDKLQLTLDRPLMERAQSALGLGSKWNPSGLPGAAVAMDPRTGELLASVSSPSFDPAMFVRGVSEKDFEEFRDEGGSKPLFNRVMDGAYPAASTYKPVTAFAMLAAGKGTVDELVNDPGKIKISDQDFQNAGAVANGSINLETALQKSSDIYFYRKGEAMNGPSEVLQSWSRKLGFGRKTGVDLPGENAGTVPDIKWRLERKAEETKCRAENDPPISQNADVFTAGRLGCGYSDKREWSVGDNVQLAVGQGDVQVTPLQIAVMYAAIQNGGKIVRPHFAKALMDRDGATRQTFQLRSTRKPVDLEGTGGLQAVRNGLYKAANEPGGTSAGVFVNWPKDRFPLYGKTGTAERQTQARDQSWYAAYVDDPKRPIVVVVTVENGGFGAETAAPIAGEILKKWYGLPDVQIVVGDSKTR